MPKTVSTVEELVLWAAKQLGGQPKPASVVKALSVEKLTYDKNSLPLHQAVRAYRKNKIANRLRIVTQILEADRAPKPRKKAPR